MQIKRMTGEPEKCTNTIQNNQKLAKIIKNENVQNAI